MADSFTPDTHADSFQPDESKSIGGFFSNLASSTGNLIGDTAHAVAHPIDTLNALGAIPVGLAEKAGVPVPAAKPGEMDSAKMLDAMIDHFKQRYGSLDSVKETLYKDPAGVLSDVSTALDGVGALGDAAKLGKVAKVAHAAADATNPISLMAKPVTAGVKAGADAAAKGAGLPGLEPNALYGSALKPRVTTPVEDVRDMAATGLKNSIPVSEAGARKLDALAQDLQQTIQAKTKAAAAAGVKIDPNAVAQRSNDVTRRFNSQVNPASDLKAIDRSRQEFLDAHSTPGTPAVPSQPTGILGPNGQPLMSPGQPAIPAKVNPIPADQAQAIKTGTYQKIRQDYGAMSTAQIESQKALARGIKEELSAKIPELTGLNEKEGKLLDLQPVLESAVNRAANRSGGFKSLVSSAAAGALSGNNVVGAGFGVMQEILADPTVRSRLAIYIHKAQQSNPAKFGKASMANALSRVNAYAGVNP